MEIPYIVAQLHPSISKFITKNIKTASHLVTLTTMGDPSSLARRVILAVTTESVTVVKSHCGWVFPKGKGLYHHMVD